MIASHVARLLMDLYNQCALIYEFNGFQNGQLSLCTSGHPLPG
uniref:Uncharacterized protein n=1 Tax=Tetranychus urticae TaxID=32264 RepID=T1JQ95_TETUR